MIIRCCLLWDWHWPSWSLSLACSFSLPSLLLSLALFTHSFSHFSLSLCHPVSDSPLHQTLICSSLTVLTREEDENRAHGATKEQIACRQECPRFEWHVMFSLSKKQGGKRKNTHFHFGSLGLPSCLRLNKDIKLFTEIHFEILHINQVNYSKHRLSTHATDDTSHYIADWGLHIFKCHMIAIRDRQNELN